MSKKIASSDPLTIIGNAVKDKIYGSVEIFFEAGSITQITQRIINKIQRPNSAKIKVNVRIKSNLKERLIQNPNSLTTSSHRNAFKEKPVKISRMSF